VNVATIDLWHGVIESGEASDDDERQEVPDAHRYKGQI
jgi:hypothetical protein